VFGIFLWIFFGWWLHNKGCGRCMVGGGLRDWGGGV
jgi:hypothetical protein